MITNLVLSAVSYFVTNTVAIPSPLPPSPIGIYSHAPAREGSRIEVKKVTIYKRADGTEEARKEEVISETTIEWNRRFIEVWEATTNHIIIDTQTNLVRVRHSVTNLPPKTP